ncbi:hypothetical protein PROFUN_15266 [Planoprotostelium fungivorum]|uniref:Sugar phosphate transporter domain-containing protein n=1 Tax=Planoprotostelium fungivorum TaxID=1890364 RepID=A0A2P6MXB3_9EUKA|nr:hypothetical protein PROFUN_15266 [Planoprotostelium fungivorum]
MSLRSGLGVRAFQVAPRRSKQRVGINCLPHHLRIVSIAITFFNKAVYQYDFNAQYFLTFGQMVLSMIFLESLRFFGFLTYENFKFETAKKGLIQLFTLALFFFAMVTTGLSGLKYVSVPMFSALRRFTTLVVIAAQYFFLKKTVPQDELWSVNLMVIGAVVASYGDITFDPWGYGLITLNCVTTAIYLVIINQKSTETGLNSFALMYYNNILSLPVIAVMTYSFEWDMLIDFENYYDIGFQFCFLMSSAMAFLLNYLVFLCTTFNTPLATSVTGQLKSILQTVIGLFTFGGIELNFAMSMGLLTSTFAGVWYGQIKYNQQMKQIRSKEKVDLETVVIVPPTAALAAVSASANTSFGTASCWYLLSGQIQLISS